MVKEIVDNNQLTIIFQNSERLLTGKFSRKSTADLSVQWLCEISKDVVIIPVMASYDRIFESNNFKSKMVSEAPQETSLIWSLKSLYMKKKDKFGEVYIKYLDPITIN